MACVTTSETAAPTATSAPPSCPGEEAPPSCPGEEAPHTCPDEEAPHICPDEEAPLTPSDERAPLAAAAGGTRGAPIGTAIADICLDGVASLKRGCATLVGANVTFVLYLVAGIAGVAQAISLLVLVHCMVSGDTDMLSQAALVTDLVSLFCTLTMRHDLDERGRQLVAFVCTYWFLRVLSSGFLVCTCQQALVAWASTSLAVLLLLRFAPRNAGTSAPDGMWLY